MSSKDEVTKRMLWDSTSLQMCGGARELERCREPERGEPGRGDDGGAGVEETHVEERQGSSHSSAILSSVYWGT